MYHQELLAHVNRPEFTKIEFSEDLQPIRPASALCVLRTLERAIENDIESLLQQVTLQHGPVISPRPLERSEKERWTNMVMQYGKKSERIFKELGPWAADYFVQKTNELYTGNTHIFTKTESRRDEVFGKLLARYFNQPGSRYMITSTLVDHPDSLSDKATKLVDLVGKQALDTTGVIFVKERIVVSMLFQILSTHPQTAGRFKFATFVGLSNNVKKRTGIHELLDLESQNKSLEAFRVKQKHIIIATDVLEEGIDVAACNLVICFDPPQNLKSFIQRRGRARKRKSRFVIMQPCTFINTKTDRWIQLEEEVHRLCQDEKRARETVLSVEDQDEILPLVLRDMSTGY
jgi:ERCC4-related helicase